MIRGKIHSWHPFIHKHSQIIDIKIMLIIGCLSIVAHHYNLLVQKLNWKK